MTKDDLANRILGMTDAMYYISYGILTNRSDQEDAVQECIRKALAKHASLRDERFVKTWVTRILINECRNILRRRKREIPTDEVFLVAPQTADASMFELLSGLADKYRLPLILHHYEGYTTKEIASILHVPEGTVKGRLVRARKELSGMLNGEEVLA
jgi:RNA polymerase sigma-70 factor (ECF subfamily)